MAILPSFYNQVDQDIYTGGEHYIPQEPYRLGYTPSTALASTIGNTGGVTNTSAAYPYIWPPQGGGGGGGGPGSNNKFGLDMDTLKTIDSGSYVEKGGPGNMYGGNYVKDSRDIAKTEGGIWKDVDTGQNVYHGNIQEFPSIIKKGFELAGLKQTGDPRTGTWTGAKWEDEFDESVAHKNLNTYQRWKAKKEFKAAQEKAAIEQAGGTDGGSFKTGDKNYGFDNSGNFTGEGLGGSSGPSENYGFDDVSGDFTGEGFGSESTGNESTAADSGGWGDDYASERIAEGGRVGYNRGRVVNPGGYQGEEEENEFSIFNPKTWFPGGPESETNPTLFGTQNSLLNKASIAQLKNAIGIYQASGKLNQEQQLDYELKLKQLEALIAGSKGQAEGGLIGYFDGGIAGLL